MITVEIDDNTLRAVIKKPGDRGGEATWDVAPDQIAQHLQGVTTKTHPWAGLPAGEVTALRDAAAEYADNARMDARNQ